MSLWKVHSKEDMLVGVNPASSFPISIELTFGTAPHTPARMEKGTGAWFDVVDAVGLISDLQSAIRKVLLDNDGKFYCGGRTVKITNLDNGRYGFETDRDESGYVTAYDVVEAVEKISSHVKAMFEKRVAELEG